MLSQTRMNLFLKSEMLLHSLNIIPSRIYTVGSILIVKLNFNLGFFLEKSHGACFMREANYNNS